MRRRWILAVLLTSGAVFAGAAGATSAIAAAPARTDWAQYRYDAAHTGFNPSETTIGAANVGSLELVWAKQADGSNNLIVDGKVLSCTFGACTSRLLSNAALQWRTPFVGGLSIASGDGSLYAVAARNQALDRLDLATGAVDQATYIAYGFAEPPTFDSGNVFVTSNRHGHAYSFGGTDLTLNWKSARAFTIDPSAYRSGPTIADGRVFAGSCTELVALRENDGRYLWSAPMTGSTQDCSSVPAVSGSEVFSTASGDLDAFDTATGKLLWSRESFDGSFSSPAVANGIVYVTDKDYGSVIAYSASDGTGLWETGESFLFGDPTVANGLVYVVGQAGLYIYDAGDGVKVNNTYRPTIPGMFFGEPVVADGSLVIGCSYPGIGGSACVFRPTSG